MSDDLISRKAVIEEVKRYRDAEYSNNDRTSRALSYVVEIIKNQPTAFDKEKVLGELSAYTDAIEIVEKGGIK